jgi:glycosyltransferase involved in cell wall biosynthesis
MISFLIPAYNEAGAIRATLATLRQTLATTSLVYEIIVIDDGSSDNTAELAAEPGVIVIQQPANGGYGRALKAGIRRATYDWCAIVDADGSYPINRFPDLLHYIPQFDMVVGARQGMHYHGSRGKRLGRWILGSLVAFVVGEKLPDVNSGMRIFRKDVALAHAGRISSGFSFTTTLTLAFFMEEYFVKYLPIDYHQRVGSSKVRIGVDSLRTLQIVVQAILYYNPLKLFLPICFLSLGVGIGLALVALIFQSDSAWLILTMGVLVAILVGALGILAEALRLHRIALLVGSRKNTDDT